MSRAPRAGAGGIRLAWRGLWFRRSTALIVLVLATVASAAAVIAPLYSRAAEESILRNTMNRADAFTLSVQVSVPFSGAGAGFGAAHDGDFTLGKVNEELTHPAFGKPRLSYVAQGQYSPTAGPIKGSEVVGQVVEREGICENLPVVEGRCPTAKGEAIAARRSMALIGADIGDTVDISLQGTATVESDKPPVVPVTIVGTFDPVPVESAYWAGRQYFSQYFPESTIRSLESVPPTADPIFVGPGTAAAANITTYTVDVPLIPSKVRLDDPETLRQQVRRLSDTVISYELTPDSKLPDALARADEGRELVRIAAPLAVTQLVLLSWWTLYLVVGSATEERSPELGLAKLRGLTARQTRRFGLAEIVLLLLVAAPLGTVIGFLAVRGSAGQFFAPGTQVLMTWSVLLTVLVALAGGVVTAWLSSRQVFRRPVSELLRRVPPRRAGRRAGLVDGVVLVLAIAGVDPADQRPRGPAQPGGTARTRDGRGRGWAARCPDAGAGRPSPVGASDGPRPGRLDGRLGQRGSPARHGPDRLGARGRDLPAARRRAGVDRRRTQPGRALRGRDRGGGRAAGARPEQRETALGRPRRRPVR